MEKKILIVDDEERVVQSISGVLQDEGFHVAFAGCGEEAVDTFQKETPDVTLLDIWMPGMDGMEVLKRLKGMTPDCQVIMISGHATISTAMAAVKLGAFDFIEKPLSLDLLLATIRRALENQKTPGEAHVAKETTTEAPHLVEPGLFNTGTGDDHSGSDSSAVTVLQGAATIRREAFPTKGKPLLVQRTLKKSMVLYGTGLHSGMKTGLLLQPLPPNSGILFGNVSSDEVVPAHLDYVETTEFATSLKRGRATAKTVEHLMAVLHAYGITNLMVKMIEEIPIMDGSASEFCRIVEEAGLEEQEEKVEELVIDRRLEVTHGGKSLVIEPGERFSIDYFLDYPAPVGQQHFIFVLDRGESFKQEIAPARTFGFVKDVEMLARMGMVEGGRFHNLILVDSDKVVNTDLRFSDEFVRHKILDLIGDFYLLNRPVRGKVTARFTGHTENITLMRKVQEAIQRRTKRPEA